MDIQIKQVETPDILKNKHRQATVYYPRELENRVGFAGYLYGYYHSTTNSFNVVAVGEERIDDIVSPGTVIGTIFPKKPSEDNLSNLKTLKSALEACAPMKCVDAKLCCSYICAYWESEKLIFEINSEQCKKEPYSLKMDVFSRNTGILETDIMLKKGALIIGCGSGGGLTALELARAGVGRFLLIDSDIFCYHNICRHQCGIPDVGKYKTDAVKERILQINPQASVDVQHCLMQEVPPSILDNFCNADTVIIEGADNRACGLYANKIATDVKIPFVSVGCWERASAGEIFYWLPIPTGMPDYKYLITVGSDISGRINQNRQFYTTEEDLAKTVFEPGISADITFVAIIAVKLIIDILNRDNPEYTPRLLNHLTQYTLVCNTNDEKIGGKRVAIFAHPLQITTSIQIAIDEPF